MIGNYMWIKLELGNTTQLISNTEFTCSQNDGMIVENNSSRAAKFSSLWNNYKKLAKTR